MKSKTKKVKKLFNTIQSQSAGSKDKSRPYPEKYLGKEEAKSAVTGGHPEEINQMPPETLVTPDK